MYLCDGYGWRWCFCVVWCCYFIPLNFEFFVDGHALEWGAVLFIYIFTFQKSHLRIRLHSLFRDDDDDDDDYGMARAFHYVSLALFKIYSISKSNRVFVRKSCTNERTNMEFERFRCIFCSFESEQIVSRSHPTSFYHHNSIEMKIWYKIETAFDGAKMQLMHHQHNNIALYEFLSLFETKKTFEMKKKLRTSTQSFSLLNKTDEVISFRGRFCFGWVFRCCGCYRLQSSRCIFISNTTQILQLVDDGEFYSCLSWMFYQ